MAAKLYEYAILFHPRYKARAKDEEADTKTELVQEPKWTLARDDKQVAMIAARSVPEKYLDDLDRIEILIRPF